MLGADRFAAAALEMVDDPVLRAMPLVGALDQLVDGTEVLAAPTLVARLRPFYEQLAAP